MTAPLTARAALANRAMDLAAALMQLEVDDPAVADAIPNGATVQLLPDDDPELFDYELQLGLKAARRGENVYLVHLRRRADGGIELAPSQAPSLPDPEPAPGMVERSA